MDIEQERAIVERARRVVETKKKMRWGILGVGILFLGISIYWVYQILSKLDNISPEEISEGFFYGLALLVLANSFGIMAAICIGKFLVGMDSDYKLEDLVVKYHDEIQKLKK